jgi:hypothetical protein
VAHVQAACGEYEGGQMVGGSGRHEGGSGHDAVGGD